MIGSASILVTLAFRAIGGISARRVADVATDRFLPIKPETRLLLRPVHDEGEPHRLPTRRRIEARDADVAVAIDTTAIVEFFHDACRVAQVEHWQSPHLPISIAGMRVVGEFDVHRPTLVEAI